MKMSKRWSMEDNVDEMALELKRVLISVDEKSNVSMMKNGLRLVFTGIEVVNSRLNLLDLEGWSSIACEELDGQDANLSRIYRKYWRRNSSSSPEVQLALSILGSIGMHHMKRSMSRQVMGGRRRPRRGGRAHASKRGEGGREWSPSSRKQRVQDESDDSSDDEAPPPRTVR